MIQKMWHILTTKYYPAFKKDILQDVTTWVIEDIILSERGQAQKDK